MGHFLKTQTVTAIILAKTNSTFKFNRITLIIVATIFKK